MPALWFILIFSKGTNVMDINLVLCKKNGLRKSFQLPSTVTVIGRREDCDLCIPLMVVSRKHCELNQDQESLTVRDLGSRNGTFLNGQQIDEAQIKAGDQLQVGPLTFAVQIDNKPEDLSVTDILQPPDGASTDKHMIGQSGTFAGLNNIEDPKGGNGTILNEVPEEPEEDL